VELHRSVSLELNRESKELAFPHRERMIELDPSEENWRALGGYNLNKATGEWERHELMFRRQGKVQVSGSGKWDTTQSQSIFNFEKREAENKGKLRGMIDQQLKNLTNRAPKIASDAVEFFTALGDTKVFQEKFGLNNRLAIGHLAELLPASDASRAEMLMGILAKMPDNSACGVFVDIAMNSENSQLVDQAIELLKRTEASRELAFLQFLRVLETVDPKKPKINAIDRAANHLQSFPDNRAIVPLIENLVSIVKKQEILKAPNAISGNNVQMGSDKVINHEIPYSHNAVHAALTQLSDGADFRFDKRQWYLWYAANFSRSNLSLRRDE
jgi:hypothetical protein